MNLKKSPGGGAANKEQVRTAAKANSDLLCRQYQLYKPDLIICGGVAGIFRHVIDASTVGPWRSTRRGVKYFQAGEGQHVLGYFHPQARYKASMLYYSLIDAVREVKEYT